MGILGVREQRHPEVNGDVKGRRGLVFLKERQAKEVDVRYDKCKFLVEYAIYAKAVLQLLYFIIVMAPVLISSFGLIF